VTRTPAKAKQLAKEEIIPIVCPDPVNQPGPYLDIIRSKHVDVVVDVAGADAGSHRFLADVVSVSKERMVASNARGIQASKLGYIYWSGTEPARFQRNWWPGELGWRRLCFRQQTFLISLSCDQL
jgi:hypothetical protein